MAHVFVADYLDDIYVGLENVGLGPMEIEELCFSDDQGNSLTELVKGMPDLMHGQVWRTFSGDLKGYVFSPSYSMKFVRLSGDDDDDGFVENRIAVRDALSKFTVKVTFKDVFGKRYNHSRDLAWFNRS